MSRHEAVREIDKLKFEFSKASGKKERGEIANTLGKKYRDLDDQDLEQQIKDLEDSRFWYNNELKLCSTPAENADCHRNLYETKYRLSELSFDSKIKQEATNHLHKAVTLANQIGGRHLQEILTVRGQYYNKQQEFKNAEKDLKESIELANQLKSEGQIDTGTYNQMMATSMNELSGIYGQQFLYEKCYKKFKGRV